MKKVTIKSQAKINFGLNVVSKREDNYHNLETIFYPVSLSDIMIFEKSDNFYFETDSEELNATIDSNLISRAVRALEQVSRKKMNIIIHLQKHIPIGAGLGGGSSNAATTLLALNELLHLNISNDKIRELALSLGSDVPFFLKPKTSYAEGRGEILHRIHFEIQKPVLIVNPMIHISSRWAYSKITPKPSEFNLKTLDKNKIVNFSELKGKVKNDFEEAVFIEYPEIAELHGKLYELGAEFVLLSGSGSSLFAIFPDIRSAHSASMQMPENYFKYIENPEKEEF
ncbi:MAG: 4-(cytidine 5'-diphospho)-2-C-methyl-D-erythritol kinase [Ignavibacteriaceae bacterium]|jgi:4-diphosphocytidyl-2-C-methyl-D-erythritol kinase|nr:4-(cytidine 5'-diphospho)-2-C-methyl-D-erythritol kinase [Ignavibacteriaceae bacterium]HPO54590.1 4-(cytidine 5'-diphospho)-2-C-methyl-D-erythritol kinase [Ignavibacteriaceae bacterium]